MSIRIHPARRRRPGHPAGRRLAATVACLLACHTATVQAVTLSERDTGQRGNFSVGFGSLGDSGNYLLDLSTLDPAFANVAGDGGSVGALPDEASASFSTEQHYTLYDNRVEFSGSVATAVAATLPTMLAYSTALSQLELALVLTEATPFELRAEVVETPGATVNGLTPRADAQIRLTGPGGSWLFNTSGSFVETGVLAAGTWRINAFADARGNGDAGFIGTLALAPVSEPAAWWLMAMGLAAIGVRRASASPESTPLFGSTPV